MMPEQDNEEQTARIRRLRVEIGRVIEREYALAGKYHELAASFEALMPDAKLRQEAVLQALSTTMKLGRQEIVQALARQQEELALLKQAVGELFTDLEAKSGSTLPGEQGSSGREQGVSTASASQQTASERHCPMCRERMSFDRNENKWKCYSCSYEEASGNKSGPERTEEKAAAPPAAVETALQKKCPMCGGQMHFHIQDGRWLCYTCAHEELPADAGEGTTDGKRGRTGAPGTASAPSFAEPLADMISDGPSKTVKGAKPSPGQPARRKTCPVCQKKMDWHAHEKIWRCFFCSHKTRY